MKTLLGLLSALCIAQRLHGQTTDPWVVFTDPVTELKGYRDISGKIRVPAKFGGLTSADTFYNIIAVHEEPDLKSYYLLKNGKAFGKDSVYMFDFTFDCEREGRIKFRDRKSNRVGLPASH